MNVQVPTAPIAAPELHLLTEWRDEDRSRRAAWAVGGAVVLHIALFFAAIGLNTYMPLPEPREETVEDLRKAVPLVLPPDALTQKAANKTKVAKELALENLTARPQVRPAPRLFTPPPAPAPAAARPAAPPPMLDAPKVDIAQAPAPVLGNVPKALEPPAAKPPQIQAEKPKLAFETPGAEITKPGGTGRIQVPKEGIEAAIRNAAKPGPGGVSVGDSGIESATPGVGQLPAQPGSAPRQASSLELMSDPMGVDFKPYLIRVLAAVRRNWFAVIPESARYGRRGKVVIQFAISRTGSVPKLVIVMPSGTEAFDRAAVAGVSASNPFPPLPSDFRGDQIRLQLAFSYNMPSR